jgi:8-oxo-dGTP diphosphatase
VAQPTSDSPRPPIAAAVIVKDGRVLPLRRRVKEGSLSWQFPAGEMPDGESAGTAAVRETYEETGLTVADTNLLGERLHPATGRMMIYVACNVIEGEAKVADNDQLADFTWATGDQLAEYVPHGFYPVVQDYLDAELVR